MPTSIVPTTRPHLTDTARGDDRLLVVGRYAPSPSGDLHVGNLRTAMLAWLSAHHHGGSLALRIDDLDPTVSSLEVEAGQRRDLAAIGIEFSGVEIRQSERFDRYDQAIDTLLRADLIYPCFCSRREIREAAAAPHQHLPDGAYPGTCSSLNSRQRTQRQRVRPAALRVRAQSAELKVKDRLYGTVTELVDDFVVRRNDGVPSYNLATVVDDDSQGVTEVVRGADLLKGTARHVWLRRLLGYPPVEHAHVPLMLNSSGERLAKRDGAVTLRRLAQRGLTPDDVRGLLATSIGLAELGQQATMSELLDRYDPTALPTDDTIWVYD